MLLCFSGGQISGEENRKSGESPERIRRCKCDEPYPWRKPVIGKPRRLGMVDDPVIRISQKTCKSMLRGPKESAVTHAFHAPNPVRHLSGRVLACTSVLFLQKHGYGIDKINICRYDRGEELNSVILECPCHV